jgi:hypothetical protein
MKRGERENRKSVDWWKNVKHIASLLIDRAELISDLWVNQDDWKLGLKIVVVVVAAAVVVEQVVMEVVVTVDWYFEELVHAGASLEDQMASELRFVAAAVEAKVVLPVFEDRQREIHFDWRKISHPWMSRWRWFAKRPIWRNSLRWQFHIL